jgi:hypothetical protein
MSISFREKRELSCDINSSLIQSEEKCLQKLVSLIDDNSIAFLRAKEAFKKSMTINGILYRCNSALVLQMPTRALYMYFRVRVFTVCPFSGKSGKWNMEKRDVSVQSMV